MDYFFRRELCGRIVKTIVLASTNNLCYILTFKFAFETALAFIAGTCDCHQFQSLCFDLVSQYLVVPATYLAYV